VAIFKEEDLHTLTSLHNPIWVYDIEEFRIHWANDQALEFWEADSREELYSRDFKNNMSQAISSLLEADLVKFRDGQEQTQWWTLFPRDKRKEVYCHYSGIKLLDGRIAMLAQVVVTKELLETELSIHSSTTIASLWDQYGHLKSTNPMFNDLYGDTLSRFDQLFFSSRQAQEIWDRVLQEREYETEIYLPTPTGDQWHNLQVRVNQSKEGNLFVVRQYDVTERKKRELHHKHLATIDSLTQLSNRYGALRFLEEAAAKIGEFSLFFIDLDNFKAVNDYYGHPQGDKLLTLVAQRLVYRFGDVLNISRLGGDEFLMMFRSTDLDHLEVIGDRLIRAVSEPFCIEGVADLNISCSVGIARYPYDGETIDTLMHHADAAMYEAKSKGKDAFVHFSKKISEELKRRQLLQKGLGKAITGSEFNVTYRPILNTLTRDLFGYNAVLGWQSAEFGYVDQAEFIPVAEESGMSGILGHFTLEKASRQIVRWQQSVHYPLIIVLPICIAQLQNTQLVTSVMNVLNVTGCAPQQVMIEVSESRLAHHADQSLATLSQFRSLGFKVAIGGFGVGNSSLSILHKLPVTHLKMAASIVKDLADGSLPIAQATVAMAKSLGLDVIAEGVTNQFQIEVLKDIGCHLVEGEFIGLIAKPDN
jgi:diguanylate cyclase (GGDEF)-like protein